MIHSGNRRLAERCRVRDFEGRELVAAVEQKKVARRFQPGELPRGRHRRLPAHGRRRSRAMWTAWPSWRPFTSGPETLNALLKLRDTFPRSEVVLVEHHAGARRLRLLRLTIRAGRRAYAGPGRRFPLRCALERERQPVGCSKGTLLSGLAR